MSLSLSRRKLLGGAMASAVAGASAVTAQTAPPRRTLIRNVRIFDGASTQLSDGHVLIEGALIKHVSTSPLPEAGVDQIIEGAARTLMPGLIDAHWHMTAASASFADLNGSDPGLMYAKSVAEAQRSIMRGFTTVRDTGGPSFGLKAAIDTGVIPGPRVFPSGAIISQTGGHGDMSAPFDRPHTLGGEPPHTDLVGQSVVANGTPEVLAAVRDQLRKGASQIKMALGGGVVSDFDPIDSIQFVPDELRAAVQAARDWGTYVAAHVYTSAGIRRALEGGVLSIEHGHLADEATIALMGQKNAWLSIQPFELGDNSLSHAQMEKVTSTGMVGSWKPALELAKKHGVKVAFGTDLLFQPPGRLTENIMLTRFAQVFGNAETLRIATSGNAALLAMSGPRNPYRQAPLGVIRAGAWADLLIVRGNPLEQIDLIARPDANFDLIMKNGSIYKNL
ncbi:MAG: amidohydrolase family protein [Candidatus Sphingomonas colombiensis]|nr:amidohydrolase family protein [Sphingomonas sp.]WEK42002.1 MAG: amidohydrolase family protein [Sphingomonas sp.]